MQNKPQIFTSSNGRVHVKDIYVGQPLESATKILVEQNFTVDRESAESLYLKRIFKSDRPM